MMHILLMAAILACFVILFPVLFREQDQPAPDGDEDEDDLLPFGPVPRDSKQ